MKRILHSFVLTVWKHWENAVAPSPAPLADKSIFISINAALILGNKSDTDLYHFDLCHVCGFSCFWVFVAPSIIDHQAPLPLKIFRQKYWSGVPFPNPVDLPYPGVKLSSLACPALAGGFFTISTTWEGLFI